MWSDEIRKTLEEKHFHPEIDRYESSAYTFKDEAKVISDVELLANQLNDMLK